MPSRAIRDDLHGLELTTIHRAKGRQWPEVHVSAARNSQLPHRRSLEVSPQDRAAGEGIEAERRLAYVAFAPGPADARRSLDRRMASRFLTEAGLVAPAPVEPPDRRESSTGRRRPAGAGGRRHRGAGVIADAQRVGLAYALRAAQSREAALEGAAHALEHWLVGPAHLLGPDVVLDLLEAIEQLDEHQCAAVLRSAGIDNDKRRVTRLHARPRARLAKALRELAARTR